MSFIGLWLVVTLMLNTGHFGLGRGGVHVSSGLIAINVANEELGFPSKVNLLRVTLVYR